MNENALHPNTQLLLSAWERMTHEPEGVSSERHSRIHPELVDCLFVLEKQEESWIFRNAGQNMANILGRELADQDFLDFWTGHDRNLTASLLSFVQEGSKPGFLKARGETLVGRRINIELTFAPLIKAGQGRAQNRLLGLYQTLGGIEALNGRPVWRHRLTEIVPPDSSDDVPRMRLVANNN